MRWNRYLSITIGPWKSISYVVKFGGVAIAFNIHTACTGTTFDVSTQLKALLVLSFRSKIKNKKIKNKSPFGISVWIIKKIDNILAN